MYYDESHDMCFCLLPPANEVLGKVIFLDLYVILFTRGSTSVHDWIPPRTDPQDQNPPEQIPPRADPFHGNRHLPRSRFPGSKHPPCTMHVGRYGQQAGGMHPTGMQSCY